MRLAGLLVDAGPAGSPVLMEVGPPGSRTDHSADPTSLHDVFFRVGGVGPAAAEVCLHVNSSHVLCDHLWIWRADHGDGVGWHTNPAATGLIVDGDDVTCLGLFVEHFQRHQTIWNGERGRTYFFQNEMPYDPPDQAAWRDGQVDGFAAYRVGPGVQRHEAWGLGSYCYFNVDPTVAAERAGEAPDAAGVRFHSVVTVSLGGTGTIRHVVNRTGDPADQAGNVATLACYP